jgi:hypothetical protein
MKTLALDRHRVILAPGVSVPTISPEEARSLRDQLVALRDTPAKGRQALVARQRAEAHDLGALRARLAVHERWSRRLRPVQTALFAVVFGLAPVVAYGREALPLPPATVVVLLLLLFPAVLGFGYKLLRARGKSAGAAGVSLLGFVLFPPGCLHLSALLGRPLFAGFAPLTVAAALLPEDAFRRLARESLRRLEIESHGGSFVAVELECARRLVTERGLHVDEVLRAPRATDPTAVSYCPLCSEEYRRGFGSCAECRVSLEPLAAPSAGS